MDFNLIFRLTLVMLAVMLLCKKTYLQTRLLLTTVSDCVVYESVVLPTKTLLSSLSSCKVLVLLGLRWISCTSSRVCCLRGCNDRCDSGFFSAL